MYLYLRLSIAPVSVYYVYLSDCVISNQSTSKNHVIRVRPSVNLLRKIHSKVLLVQRYKGLTSLGP